MFRGFARRCSRSLPSVEACESRLLLTEAVYPRPQMVSQSETESQGLPMLNRRRPRLPTMRGPGT